MMFKSIVAMGFALVASTALAQTIKIGFITSYSGLNGNLGPYMERAVRLYIKEHQKELPPGVKIELITRDDTGPNPDKAKQLAQELIVRDKVNLLALDAFDPVARDVVVLALRLRVVFRQLDFIAFDVVYRADGLPVGAHDFHVLADVGQVHGISLVGGKTDCSCSDASVVPARTGCRYNPAT